MRAVVVAILIVSVTNTCASFKIDSMLDGSKSSIGPYDSSVSVGNISEKYNELQPDDVKASENAVQLVELLRRMFGVGIYTLPPLDPFTSNDLKPLVLGSDNFISGKVLLKSVTITGAKKFNLTSLQLRLKTGRIDFEINVPEINFKADFVTDLYLGGLIPLSLKGQLSGQIDQLQLTGALQTEEKVHRSSSLNVVYQVSGASVHVRTNDIKVALANGLHLEKDLLESLDADDDSSSLSKWITSMKNTVNKYVINTFISLANNVLNGLSVAQVNAYLLPESTE